MQLERDTLLNQRYRIVEILGKGGMGSVYRAIDENLGVEVAVKDNLFTTDEYARQFRREASLLAGLRHPNLPRVTDHFVIEAQGQYLIMDYIEGEDLRQRMERQGEISQEDVIVIGAAVCDALSYLGSRDPPVIHRDIKPGNIRITPQGQIFLVDFGLAKTFYGSQVTTTGARAMTPGYSPPEQYGTARTDQRSDIYSLGATLYAALTNIPPEDALARAMDQAELTLVRQHDEGISQELSSVIEKALAIRPNDRYQTSDEFKLALINVDSIFQQKNGEYVVEPAPADVASISLEEGFIPEAIVDEVAKAESKPKIPQVSSPEHLDEISVLDDKRKQNIIGGCLWVFSIIIILIAGLSVVFYSQYPETTNYFLNRYLPEGIIARATTPLLVVSTSTLMPTEIQFSDTPTLVESIPELPTLTFSPLPTDLPIPTETPTANPTLQGGGGGQIAYASNESGTNQIYVIDVDGSGKRRITNFPEGACQPDWSPDGEKIVFISPCKTNSDYYQGAAMFVINTDGTGLLPLPTMQGGDYDPKWSPDGTQIVFTSLRNSGRQQLYLLNLADNSLEALSEKYSFDYQASWSKDGKELMYISSLRGAPKIWVMDANGNNPRQFSQGQAFIYSRPSWSKDGKNVLFTQLLREQGIPRVGIATYDFSEYVEYYVGQESLPMREAVFSPDGLWIAFEGWEAGGSHNIYLIAVTGAGRTQVTDSSGTDFDPVWKPIP